MMKQKILPVLLLGLGLLFLYLPIGILAVYSFTDSATIGAIRQFSLSNYNVLFTTEELRNMIGGTLLLAVGSAILATILGTLGAIGAFYSKRLPNMVITTMNEIPVINADVVTGFSLCVLLIIVLGIDKNTFIPLVAGHTVLSAPFVYLSVIPKLKQMDSNYYEAALDLGATAGQALRKVILPHIFPGIFSGFIMAMTLSLDDYFVATYTKPATFDTISTYVVNATKGAQTEIKTALWALSTIIFLIVVVAVCAMNLLEGREQEET